MFCCNRNNNNKYLILAFYSELHVLPRNISAYRALMLGRLLRDGLFSHGLQRMAKSKVVV